MKERGLGTPATRADTIDGLINQKYMERNQRELVPTTKAESLLQFLAAVKADALTKPDMTGEWEFKLRQMEHGKFPRRDFMAEIVEVTKGIVERTKNFEEDESHLARHRHHFADRSASRCSRPCAAYKSQDGELMIYKVMSGRKIEEDEVRAARREGRDRPARRIRFRENRQSFPLQNQDRGGREKSRTQKSGAAISATRSISNALVPFWTDPKTGAELCEAATNYILREREGGGWKETFKVGRLMCQKEITREQAIQLVTRGKTDLIEKFTSKKGRPFDAYLVRQGARIAWEFPPRKPREGGAKNGKDAPPQGKTAARSGKGRETGRKQNPPRRSLPNGRRLRRRETADRRFAAGRFRIETQSLRQRYFRRGCGAVGGVGQDGLDRRLSFQNAARTSAPTSRFRRTRRKRSSNSRRARVRPRKIVAPNFFSTDRSRNFLRILRATTCSGVCSPDHTMRCPKCGNRDDKVIDSRQSRDSSSIRRRRVCLACAFRFTTYEEIERTDLRVIKRDRTHEIFDRRKLANSVAKACEKRSISLMALEKTVDDIVHETGDERARNHLGCDRREGAGEICANSMRWPTSVTPRSIGISRMSSVSSMKFMRLVGGSSRTLCSPSCLTNPLNNGRV